MRRILLLSLFSVLGLAQDAPVGIVTMTQGDAKMTQPGAKNPMQVEIADVLPVNSRITTTKGKVSFVSCVQSIAGQIQPDSDVLFTAAGYDVKKGSVAQVHKIPSCHVPVTNVGGPNAHLGGVNMRGGETTMQLLSPVGTAVDPAQVSFRWQPVEGATLYRVALRDSSGNDLWEYEVKAPTTSLAYSGEKKLSPGASYRWRVTALQGDEVLSSASAKMDVFSAEDLAHITTTRKQSVDPAESHLLLGMLYEELNAPELALAEYQKVQASTKSKWLGEKISGLKPKSK